MKKAIYLSYDLGLKGDYNGLYIWLDSLQAKECGNNLALFQLELDDEDLDVVYGKLKSAIRDNVKLASNDRIYIIIRDHEGLIKGKFLFGGRKNSPWDGFSSPQDEGEDSN